MAAPSSNATDKHDPTRHLQLQLAIEDIFAGVAKGLGRDCVLVCDRGTMDGKAYLTEAQWLQMLDELSLLPERLRDRRYEAVVHLVTAADGAEAFYTLANNKARSETAEEAKAMDLRSQQVCGFTSLDLR